MSLRVSLTRLGLDGRLKWWEVERLLDLAQAETEQAIADLEFEDWWLGQPLRTARYRAIWEQLKI